MSAASLSSGDLQADRRFAMAEAYLRDGDGAAGVDLLRQALEIAPGWAAAWFRLGEALEQVEDRSGADEAFRRAIGCDPADVLGAGIRLGRLAPGDPQAAMSPAYVAALFDQYAERFDEHLVDRLAYRGPQIITEALRRACVAQGRPLRFSAALDLGCGTGLMARAIRSEVALIDGADLSPEMVRKAAATGLYRRTWVGDVVAALPPAPAGNGPLYDLILAADVICYMSDLTRLLNAVAQAIPPQGLFAFTFQRTDGPGHRLGADLRHHHSEAYVRETATAAGLAVLHAAACVPRLDAGEPVPGMVMVLAKGTG